MRRGADGKEYADWFSGDDTIEVQMSRHRFTFAGVPAHSTTWREIQSQYETLRARRAAVAS